MAYHSQPKVRGGAVNKASI